MVARPSPPSRARRSVRLERGFTLAAVVIILAVMAIMLAVAVQTASFQKQREKEEELIFRGNQIVEGVRLFRARHGRYPIKLGELARAQPWVVRKVWTDPITGNLDWVPVFLGQEGTEILGGSQGGGGQGAATPTPTPTGGPQRRTATTGAIIGVHSRSCEQSIKIYNGRTRYCDWLFYLTTASPVGLGPGVGVGGGGPSVRTPPPVRPTRTPGDRR